MDENPTGLLSVGLVDRLAKDASDRKPQLVSGEWLDGKQRLATPRANGDWSIIDIADPAKAPDRAKPDRIRAAPKFDDMESFSNYVKEFKDIGGETKLFADVNTLSFTALLDYHSATDGASLQTHKATYQPRPDAVFASWREFHKKKISQETFGRFLETHAMEISSPKAADILETAMDLNIKVNVTYQSRKDLGNGLVGFEYKETAEDGATSTKGNFRIPKEMIVHMPVFFGEDSRQFTVMIRYYPQKDQPLQFSIEIHRLEYEIEDAFLAIRQRIADAVGLKPLLGRLARD